MDSHGVAKRTKIIATIGPASREPSILAKLLAAGMNVARINMAHGTPDEHRETIQRLRIAAGQANLPLAIMADTKGPGIRTGALEGGRLDLSAGQVVTLVEDDDMLGNAQRIPIGYEGLTKHLHVGDTVWLANGEIGLRVLALESDGIHCRVENPGILSDHKRVNIPEARLPSVSEADRQDIEFAASCGVDYLAASFVREAGDIQRVRQILRRNSQISVVAKIETPEAIANSEAIIAASDAVMVARGDLGVEIPLEEVPLAQRRLVQQCRQRGVPVIIATQMLKSMVDSPRPTRAEVSDIATAILEGADAIMLSEETAAGHYPVESVTVMSRIAQRIEREQLLPLASDPHRSTPEAIGQSACLIAESIDAAAIITSTRSGSTARLVAKFRPRQLIIAVTYSEEIRNGLALVWGVTPLVVPFSQVSTDEMLQRSIEATLRAELLEKGDWVVLTAGAPFGVSGTTNLIKVERV